jgi:hypothetical protein
MSLIAIAHKGVAVAIAATVPLAVYLINDSVEEWTFGIGAVMGFSYWYFLDPLP